jgi:hypothetical protein
LRVRLTLIADIFLNGIESVMKFVVLLLVLAIMIPPVQAGGCDVETGQTSAHQMQATDNGDRTCCDSGQTESPQGCSSDMLCGFCSASTSSIPATPRFSMIWQHHYSRNTSSGAVAPSHSSPLFRPPIS